MPRFGGAGHSDSPTFHCIARNRSRSTDSRGGPYSVEVVSAGIPRGVAQLFSTAAKPGESYEGHPMIGEVVLYCNKGMVRVSVGDESHVIREGDTLQFRTDDGYRGENIGEDDSLLTAVLATPTRFEV